MVNFVQTGDTLTLTAPYDRTSGQMAKIGSFIVVAVNDVLNGASSEWMTEGVFNSIAKKTGDAASAGTKLYWDDSNKYLTTTSSGNTLAGAAVGTIASADTTCSIRLNGTV